MRKGGGGERVATDAGPSQKTASFLYQPPEARAIINLSRSLFWQSQEAAMPIRFWNLEIVCLAVVAFVFAGCEAQPAAAPMPLRVAQTGSTPAPQPVSTSPAATAFSLPIGGESETVAAAPSSTSSGFSLPIGTEIPPSAAPPAAGQKTLNIPPLGQQPQGENSPALSPASPAATPPPAAQGKSIHLSAGVAVPQSLPIGTVMAMSVDYSVDARLNPSSRYVWVIKSAAGESLSEVKLDNSGNLSAFFEQLKPEHRPFSARIEEITPGSDRRTIVSNEVPLQTSY